jgi:hypothetical protein
LKLPKGLSDTIATGLKSPLRENDMSVAQWDSVFGFLLGTVEDGSDIIHQVLVDGPLHPFGPGLLAQIL